MNSPVKSITLGTHMWQSQVRNPTLLCCVFWLCYHVQRAVAQNFHLGRGSYMLRRLIRYSCIFAGCMSPTLNGSFALQCFKRGNTVRLRNGIMFVFYPGLPHMLCCLGILLWGLIKYHSHCSIWHDNVFNTLPRWSTARSTLKMVEIPNHQYVIHWTSRTAAAHLW